MGLLFCVLLTVVLLAAAFAIYWIFLAARLLYVYDFLIQYSLLRLIMHHADITLHSDYLEFQSEFEKLDEQYRLLNLAVEEIERSSGWGKVMLYKKLPRSKESSEMLDRLDVLVARWAIMVRELVAEGKIEIEGGE